jgi:ribosomal protein S24E
MAAIEITSDRKNKLLCRRELEFSLPGKLTPSRTETKAALAKQLGVPEGKIVIDSIVQRTGSNITLGKAKIYDSEDAMKKLSFEYKAVRGEKKKEPEAAAKPAEKPAEKPPEKKQ